MELLFLLQPIMGSALSGSSKPLIMYDFFKNSPPIVPPTQIASPSDPEKDNPFLNLSLSCNYPSPPMPRTRNSSSSSSSSDCTVIDPEENNPLLKLTLSCNPPSSYSSSSSSCKSKKKRKRSQNQETGSRRSRKKTVLLGSQERQNGSSDEFVIKKVLEESDVNNLARLMLGKASVEEQLMAYWDEDMKERLKTKEGLAIRVWDLDCDVVYDMKMKIWGRGSVVLNDSWINKFVKRRGLKRGDQIGLYWDRTDSRLVFSVLHQEPIDATPISFRLPDC